MKINANKCKKYGIGCYSDYGPTFGGGNDISIASYANLTMYSFSNLGYSFKRCDYSYGKKNAKIFLSGTFKFQLMEIEVYHKK